MPDRAGLGAKLLSSFYLPTYDRRVNSELNMAGRRAAAANAGGSVAALAFFRLKL